MSPALFMRLSRLAAVAVFLAGHASAQVPDLVRIPLTRVDGLEQGIGNGTSFDSEEVKKAMAATPVLLPDPLPPGARVGRVVNDTVFVLVDRAGPSSAGLVVDVNSNGDLRDDPRIEVPKTTVRSAAPIVMIRRAYPGALSSAVSLPYRIQYTPQTNKAGQLEPSFFISPAYRMEGTFRIAGREYLLFLHDFNGLGRFDRSNLSRGTVLAVRGKGEPAENGASLWGHELIPLGEEFYEVSDFAVDGSWLEIRRYAGPLAAIGRAVPDFRMTDTSGRSFELRDYRGRYLLLDFWPSWCAPCVREFANIKAVVQSHADQPLSVIGVNLDTEKALPVARKVIADQALPWPQVLEGRGYFLPAYQVLGRLPEKRGVFPLYVIIEPDGRVGYATNDFLKMRRFLDAAFAPAADRRDRLFVPLSAPRVIPPGESLPVDFADDSLGTVRTDPGVKLPRDLPDAARIGRLPNGVLVIVRRDADGQMWIRVDINADRDLTDHEDVRIPMLGRAPVAPDEAPAVRMNLPYASGARSFRPFRFFARPSADGGPPQVSYVGYGLVMTGTFVRDGIEYAVSISDPTGDLTFTDDDARTARFLTLTRKQGAWPVAAVSSTEEVLIGGKRFRLAHVHDDGELIELEEQRGPAQRRKEPLPE